MSTESGRRAISLPQKTLGPRRSRHRRRRPM